MSPLADAETSHFREIECRLAPGDVLVCEATAAWIPRAIARFTRSRFSHVALVLGRRQVLEVSLPVVRIEPLSFYAGRPFRVLRPPFPSAKDRSRAAKAATETFGWPYGTRRLLSYFLLRDLRRRWRSALHGDLVCSGVVAHALSRGRIVFRDDIGRELDPATGVSPADLVRQATREGWAVVAEWKDVWQGV